MSEGHSHSPVNQKTEWKSRHPQPWLTIEGRHTNTFVMIPFEHVSKAVVLITFYLICKSICYWFGHLLLLTLFSSGTVLCCSEVRCCAVMHFIMTCCVTAQSTCGRKFTVFSLCSFSRYLMQLLVQLSHMRLKCLQGSAVFSQRLTRGWAFICFHCFLMLDSGFVYFCLQTEDMWFKIKTLQGNTKDAEKRQLQILWWEGVWENSWVLSSCLST